MSDLIERADAIQVARDTDYMGLYVGDVKKVTDEVIKGIKAIPIAEPKVGKWLWQLADNGWADHICSVCGYTKNTDIHVSLGWRYCPNCGAKMERSE